MICFVDNRSHQDNDGIEYCYSFVSEELEKEKQNKHKKLNRGHGLQ